MQKEMLSELVWIKIYSFQLPSHNGFLFLLTYRRSNELKSKSAYGRNLVSTRKMVRMTRFELAPSNLDWHLKPARLPIPPHPQIVSLKQKNIP